MVPNANPGEPIGPECHLRHWARFTFAIWVSRCVGSGSTDGKWDEYPFSCLDDVRTRRVQNHRHGSGFGALPEFVSIEGHDPGGSHSGCSPSEVTDLYSLPIGGDGIMNHVNRMLLRCQLEQDVSSLVGGSVVCYEHMVDPLRQQVEDRLAYDVGLVLDHGYCPDGAV